MANEPRLEREVAEIIEILVEKMKFEVIWNHHITIMYFCIGHAADTVRASDVKESLREESLALCLNLTWLLCIPNMDLLISVSHKRFNIFIIETILDLNPIHMPVIPMGKPIAKLHVCWNFLLPKANFLGAGPHYLFKFSYTSWYLFDLFLFLELNWNDLGLNQWCDLINDELHSLRTLLLWHVLNL